MPDKQQTPAEHNMTRVSGTFDQVFQQILGDIHVKRILDAATGRGSFIEVFQNSIPGKTPIDAFDLDPGLLNAAFEQYAETGVNFCRMDAAMLGMAGDSYDMVGIGVSLHHLSDIQTVLHELKRVLKPGGLCFISEMYCDGLTDAQLSEANLHHWVADIDSAQGKVHNHTLTKNAIIKQVELAEWAEVRCFDFTNPESADDTPEEHKKFLEEIDELINNRINEAQKLENGRELEKRGEGIRSWIHTHGMNRVSILMALCKK